LLWQGRRHMGVAWREHNAARVECIGARVCGQIPHQALFAGSAVLIPSTEQGSAHTRISSLNTTTHTMSSANCSPNLTPTPRPVRRRRRGGAGWSRKKTKAAKSPSGPKKVPLRVQLEALETKALATTVICDNVPGMYSNTCLKPETTETEMCAYVQTAILHLRDCTSFDKKSMIEALVLYLQHEEGELADARLNRIRRATRAVHHVVSSAEYD